jgi:TonB family protein
VFERGLAIRAEDRYPTAMDFARSLYEACQPALDVCISRRPEAAPATEVETRVETRRTRASASVVAETLRLGSPGSRREAALLLDSNPSAAQVYVDGVPLGATPVSGHEVCFGRHVVRMEAEGREAVSVEVEVGREDALRAITVGLPLPQPSAGSIRPGQFVEFGPDVTPPRRIAGQAPEYPEAAKERGLEGSPMVDVWISETGDVIDLAIADSAGANLDDALLRAVAGWRFEPATVDGVPVSVRMRVQHVFRR